MCETKSEKEVLERWQELEKKVIPRLSTDELERKAMIKYLLIKMSSMADESEISQDNIEKNLSHVIPTTFTRQNFFFLKNFHFILFTFFFFFRETKRKCDTRRRRKIFSVKI